MKTATHYQHLKCTNDTNGNPRRVFVLYDAAGNIAQAIDEGYGGKPESCRGLIELPSYNIAPAERRDLLKAYRAA